jgi:hypothetical protein
MWGGFVIAAKGMRWDAPIGGAINGTGMGIMHWVGMYAVAVPGFLEWNYPLVLASLGLGVGLNSAAMTVYHWRKGVAATWLATGLLTLAFVCLHVTGMKAAHFVSGRQLSGRVSAGPDRRGRYDELLGPGDERRPLHRHRARADAGRRMGVHARGHHRAAPGARTAHRGASPASALSSISPATTD